MGVAELRTSASAPSLETSDQGAKWAHSSGVAWRSALVMVCVVVIDQLSKHWVETSIIPSEEHNSCRASSSCTRATAASPSAFCPVTMWP